jgi:Tol biopolymer transport system component
LKEELRQTGYRLVIAIHPDKRVGKEGEYPPRDLYLINADGTGLKPLTNTPDKDENTPRTSPDGKLFTRNYGDVLVDAKSLKTRQLDGGNVWTPDSQRTAECGKRGIVTIDVKTGKRSEPIPVPRRVSITDLSADGQWFIFEIRDYLGSRYTIDFMPAAGGDIRKLPNHPARRGKEVMGECHPAFSPDGKWLCWNAGGGLGIRKFVPSRPEGTDGETITLPGDLVGQDPCGRWSHCGRYIAVVKIPSAGSWKVHSPICIVRLADKALLTLTPPGWLGHHWDYDWLPPDEETR